MNVVDVVRKLWNNNGLGRPWSYVMPVTIVTAGNLDEEDGDSLAPLQVALTGPSGIPIVPESVSTVAGVSSVAGAASDTLILAANANRKGASVFNDSTAVCYLKLGGGSSSTVFTVKMDGGGYYEVPFRFTGALYGTWASATGSARVTEVS